jgi:hypothetical protein
MADQNWAWFVIAGCAFVLRRGFRGRGAVVSSLKLSPGEQILISVRDRRTPVNGAASTAATAAPDEV